MQVFRIVLTGPESSGKTTLAAALAEHYQSVWVPEYARSYLEERGGAYEASNLLEIARGQIALEASLARESGGLLFCDTDLLVLKIWSEYRFGSCHPFILEQLQRRPADLYLLCRPDLPWEFDPLRENPADRDQLFALYKKQLQEMEMPHAEIFGHLHVSRLELARSAIEKALHSKWEVGSGKSEMGNGKSEGGRWKSEDFT